MGDILYIVIPAYNESENIKEVVYDWYDVIKKLGGESRLVIIDDGSRDNTYEIMCTLAEERPLLIPLTKSNGGHGSTCQFGYHYALDRGADYIFQTDSDGQTLSSEFWDFWNKREQCDAAIGTRLRRQDGFSRVLVTRILRLVLWFIFRVWIKDANTPFRLMKSEKLREYLEVIPKKFNLVNVLISVTAKLNDDNIIWEPITFRPRQGGKNSINLFKICKIGIRALKDFRIFRNSYKIHRQNKLLNN